MIYSECSIVFFILNYQLLDDENSKYILHKVHADLNTFSNKVDVKIASGEFPNET